VAEDKQQQRFAEVVVPHLDDALSLARWLTGSLADGEDVVQEACIRAFGAVGSFRDGSPRAWLLTIVRNTAFTWLRKNRPKALIVTDDDSVFESAGIEADAGRPSGPEAALIAKADGELLNAAIAALPMNFREILVLREIDGLSYREIAEVVSLPIGTVMSRLSRARQLLIAQVGRAQGKAQGVA
jgi:RNA polymerase sigma-70 factor, ECF subfamily